MSDYARPRRDDALNPHDRAALNRLRAQPETSFRRLAALTGRSVTQVQRSLAKLKRLGLVPTR